MDPEIVEMVRFLDPEIVEKVDKSYISFPHIYQKIRETNQVVNSTIVSQIIWEYCSDPLHFVSLCGRKKPGLHQPDLLTVPSGKLRLSVKKVGEELGQVTNTVGDFIIDHSFQTDASIGIEFVSDNLLFFSTPPEHRSWLCVSFPGSVEEKSE